MRNLLTLAALLGALSVGGAAEAYWWQGAGLGIGGLYRSLDYPTERRVPYFAAHPPVYYSQPVPRTYGYSPYAYTPDTRTPEIVPTVAAQPQTIINPYVQSSTTNEASQPQPAKKPTRNRTIGHRQEAEQHNGPLTILNPYVEQKGGTI